MEFKFNVKVPKKKRNIYKQVSLQTIIERNCEGICYVDIDGYFICICNDKIYNFTKQSYTLFNGTLYSTHLIENKLLKTIRLSDIPKGSYKPSYMMPFMAGVICKGNIVKNNINNELQFDLKMTRTDWSNQKAKDYFKFYREHYNTIINKIKENERLSNDDHSK